MPDPWVAGSEPVPWPDAEPRPSAEREWDGWVWRPLTGNECMTGSDTYPPDWNGKSAPGWRRVRPAGPPLHARSITREGAARCASCGLAWPCPEVRRVSSPSEVDDEDDCPVCGGCEDFDDTGHCWTCHHPPVESECQPPCGQYAPGACICPLHDEPGREDPGCTCGDSACIFRASRSERADLLRAAFRAGFEAGTDHDGIDHRVYEEDAYAAWTAAARARS